MSGANNAGVSTPDPSPDAPTPEPAEPTANAAADTDTADAVDPTMRARCWVDGRLEPRAFHLRELDSHLSDPRRLVWVDLVAPDPDKLAQLGAEIGMSAQAVEDVLAHLERPKATRHGDRIFLTMYATRLLPAGGAESYESRLQMAKISAFVLPRGIVTIRPDDSFDMQDVVDRWEDNADLVAQAGPAGVGALMHGLLDAVVDSHFDTIQQLDDAVEAVEDVLFDDDVPTRQVQRSVYRIRKELVELRRVVLPMRELVNGVLRHRATGLASSISTDTADPAKGDAEALLRPWYDDLYDHVLRAAEWTESLRDMVSTLFETNLSLQDARLNTVMKKLAAWAAIIAVPTAVTGWFGQNIPYPGFQDTFGFWQSVVLVVLGIVALYVVFKRRDWL